MSEQSERDSIGDKLVTLPEEWSIASSGYENQKQSGDVAETIDALLRLLAGNGTDLRSLDGVTLALDCQTAAAQLQQWPDGQQPIEVTERDHVMDLARTVAVWRGAELRFHIVLRAGIGLMAISGKQEQYKLALACIAHEAAHVEHEGNLYRACPHAYGCPLDCGERSHRLFFKAMDTWSEYAACRSSAFFRPEGAEEFEGIFCATLQQAIALANGGDKNVGIAKRTEEQLDAKEQLFGDLFIYAGYFLGHLDGLGLSLEQRALRASEQLRTHPKVYALLLRLQETLRKLWLTELSWSSLEVFAPIYDLLQELIEMDAMHFRSSRPILVNSGPRGSDS